MKTISLRDTRHRSRRDTLRLEVQAVGLSGWVLDNERRKIEGAGEVTTAQLEEMRDRAAFALKCAESALALAAKIEVKA